MKAIVDRLDCIAEGLELKGLMKEAAEVDMLSNTLEAAMGGMEKDVPLTPEQKKRILSDPDYSSIARDLNMKFNDVQLLRIDSQPVKYRLVFLGEGEPIKALDLRHYNAPGMEISLDSFSMLVGEGAVPRS